MNLRSLIIKLQAAEKTLHEEDPDANPDVCVDFDPEHGWNDIEKVSIVQDGSIVMVNLKIDKFRELT